MTLSRNKFLLPFSFIASWSMIASGVVAQQQQPPRASTGSPRPELVDGREDLTEYLPPGKGKTLVAKQCSTCHDIRSTINLRKTRAAWEAIILDMVARGAPLMIEEVDPIVDYLVEAFGPKAPPLVNINSADKDDLIRLPGVSPSAADQLIAHRTGKGPLSSRDEVRTILGLDDRAFERIKWYMQVARGAAARE